jgi:uncharacterized protein YoxC
MDLKAIVEKLNTLNNDVNQVVAFTEKLVGTVDDLVNEVQKLIVTKAEADSITINDPEG